MTDTTQPTKTIPNIMVGTPCYGGQVFVNYFTSILGLVNTVRQRNDVSLGFRVRGGDSLITRARNSIVAEFLANEQFTHLLWIDADIGFTPDAIYRLINSGHDIAAGVYPLKALTLPEELNGNRDELFKKHQRYPFNPVNANNIDVKNGFIEVKDAPTGLMLIKREVFLKMIEAYPDLKYYPDKQVGLEGIAAKISNHYFNFFDTFIDEEGRYLSEDYAFCRLWQRIGGKVHVDALSKLSHQGSYKFEGDFHGMLSSRYQKQD